MDRRTVLKTGAAAAATLAMPAYLRAQSNKKLSILTWNIADQEAMFKEEFADFQKQQSRRRDRMARQEGPGFSRLLPDPAGRRHRARHRRPAGRALGGMGGQRRPARPHALLPERAGSHQALQPGLHVELRLREEELSGSVLCLQDAALLQQADVQGGRPHRAAEELRRTHHLLERHGQGRKDRVPDPEFRLAVLADPEDERHRAPDTGLQEAGVQHPRGDQGDRAPERGDGQGRHQQDRLDRPLGRAQRRLRLRHGRHAACPLGLVLLRQGPGQVDQSRHARRDARRPATGRRRPITVLACRRVRRIPNSPSP